MEMKSYADSCLERAEKATPGPWECSDLSPSYVERPGSRRMIPIMEFNDAQFISHARQDVEELARRLKRACEKLKWIANQGNVSKEYLIGLADELEAMPEGGK